LENGPEIEFIEKSIPVLDPENGMEPVYKLEKRYTLEEMVQKYRKNRFMPAVKRLNEILVEKKELDQVEVEKFPSVVKKVISKRKDYQEREIKILSRIVQNITDVADVTLIEANICYDKE